MYGFLCKRLVRNVKFAEISTQNLLGFLQTIAPPPKSFSSASSCKKASSLSIKDEQQSFTVSYLMNSCGLSLDKAIAASKIVQYKSPLRPDSVLKLFRNHGFTNAQITRIVRQRPEFLLANPEKTLLPKIEFFKSIGLSPTVLSIVLSSHASLLSHSLNNHLIPSYKFIKSVINVNEKVAVAVKNFPRIMQVNVGTTIAPNISVLIDHGVPASYISLVLTSYSRSLVVKCDKFKKCVNEVIEMGIDPSALAFVIALQIIVLTTESTWNRKLKIYLQWGWSETEFRAAFRAHPILMASSEMKITSTMQFLVDKMGLESGAIARNPSVLDLSLEKRIIPRCSVIKLLLLKGLIKKDLGLSSYLFPTEKAFVDKFVIKYEENVPELLSVYQGKMRIF